MSDIALPVRLTEPQRRHLAALLRADIRKGERRIANAAAAGRAFVPSPGRRDVAKWELERKRELLALIADAAVERHDNECNHAYVCVGIKV